MSKKDFNPASSIQDIQYFGEFGGVNPSITDSSTYTYMKPETMEAVFNGEEEGCFLYSRHWNPSNRYLAEALAKLENTEAAQVMGSGMGAITSVLMQLCKSGDEIITSRTIYGGTHAFLQNFAPQYGIKVHFVDITNLEAVKAVTNDNTKVIYTEALSNPLLEVADIPELKKISAALPACQLVVDNTFTPMVITPANLGADIVVHSLTKFINGASDTMGGAVCASQDFINALMDVNDGAAMLLGPAMDGVRSASILKNLRTLHIRMVQHGKNAKYLAERLTKDGMTIKFPGLEDHPQHGLMKEQMNEEFGYSGMLLFDLGTKKKAYEFMYEMQQDNVGYLAVSLGFYKTLFSAPGSSTSSEISEEEQKEMNLSEGYVRMSVGIDMDIERTYQKMNAIAKKIAVI